MSIIGSIFLFIIGVIFMLALAAWLFVRNIMSGFRDGSRRRRANAGSGASKKEQKSSEDSDSELEDGPGRRYYFNRTKTVDKERAEDVDFEEVK